MGKYFLLGLLLYAIILSTRILIVAIWSLYHRESIRKNIDITLGIVALETLFFSAVVGGGWFIADLLESQSAPIVLAFCVLFVSIIPSYHYMIRPIVYLVLSKKYEMSPELEDFLRRNGFDYRVRIIRNRSTGAYATGVLPFSKTILIGADLVAKMPKDQLHSLVFHEVGHLKHNHLAKLYMVHLIVTACFVTALFIFIYAGQHIFTSYPFVQPLGFALWGFMGGLAWWYLPGKVQRRMEFQADVYAAERSGSKALIAALRTLDTLSKGKVSKGGITHPSLLKRARYIQVHSH